MDRYPLHELVDDPVRALAWCIGAPSLMGHVPGLVSPPDAAFRDALAQAWQWLCDLDQDPMPLHEHLAATRSWKVGFYFETLLSFWLHWSPLHTVLAQELQVRDHERTLGAFDFMLRDVNGEAQHWEVAVKFYLQREPSEQWEAWVGPNQRDRLDLKLEHMRGHQLPLSARPEAKSTLSALHIHGAPKQVAVVKGMFFAPWTDAGQRPLGCAAEAALGQWVLESDFTSFSEAQPPCRWCMREKPDWLGPARRLVSTSFSTADAVQRLQANRVVRPQLWSRLRELEGGVWFEDSRIFVVPDTWR